MPRPTGHHKDPTRQVGNAELGAFEYVGLNPVSETGSVLMKITRSNEVQRPALLHCYHNFAA